MSFVAVCTENLLKMLKAYSAQEEQTRKRIPSPDPLPSPPIPIVQESKQVASEAKEIPPSAKVTKAAGEGFPIQGVHLPSTYR